MNIVGQRVQYEYIHACMQRKDEARGVCCVCTGGGGGGLTRNNVVCFAAIKLDEVELWFGERNPPVSGHGNTHPSSPRPECVIIDSHLRRRHLQVTVRPPE